VLQELGGWSNYEMVHRYAHLSVEHLADCADSLSEIQLVSTKLAQSKKRQKKSGLHDVYPLVFNMNSGAPGEIQTNDSLVRRNYRQMFGESPIQSLRRLYEKRGEVFYFGVCAIPV
jgi:hypothetical protein